MKTISKSEIFSIISNAIISAEKADYISLSDAITTQILLALYPNSGFAEFKLRLTPDEVEFVEGQYRRKQFEFINSFGGLCKIEYQSYSAEHDERILEEIREFVVNEISKERGVQMDKGHPEEWGLLLIDFLNNDGGEVKIEIEKLLRTSDRAVIDEVVAFLKTKIE